MIQERAEEAESSGHYAYVLGMRSGTAVIPICSGRERSLRSFGAPCTWSFTDAGNFRAL